MNRYDMEANGGELIGHWVDAIKEEDGGWVRYDEIEPKLDGLERELAELTAVCEILIDVMLQAILKRSES